MKGTMGRLRLLLVLALAAGFAALIWARWSAPIPYPLPGEVQVQISAYIYSSEIEELAPEKADEVAALLRTLKVRRGFPESNPYKAEEAVTLTISGMNTPYFSNLYLHRDKPHASRLELRDDGGVQEYYIASPEQALTQLAALLAP